MEPLVLGERLVYQSTRAPIPAKPPTLWYWFLCTGIIFATLLLVVGHFVRRHWAPRVLFILLALPWVLLMGVGGFVIVWGWMITDHAVAKYNENLLHLSPLMLPLVVFLPKLVVGRRTSFKLVRCLAVGAAGGSLLGLLLKVLPSFYQYNWDIIALALPVNVALAFIVWRLADVAEGNLARATAGQTSSRELKSNEGVAKVK